MARTRRRVDGGWPMVREMIVGQRRRGIQNAAEEARRRVVGFEVAVAVAAVKQQLSETNSRFNSMEPRN